MICDRYITQKNNKIKENITVLTIISVYILCGVEVDLFVPSFPELQVVFNLSPFMVELSLGINLFAHCLTSFVVGILGDKYGRKPVILWGLNIFIVGSICCVVASQYWVLLLGRLLQGIGISGPAVLTYIIISDIYSVEKQQRLMGIINGVVASSMAFAPVLGSYISLLFHWQGNFVALLILGLSCLGMCAAFLPGSTNTVKSPSSDEGYKIVLNSSKAVYYITTVSLLLIPYWFFVGISPLLYMDDLGVTLETFGFYQGSMALLFSVFSFSSSYAIKKWGQRKCFAFSMVMLIGFFIASLILILFKINDPLLITLTMLLQSIGIIFPINILFPLSLETIAEAKGKIAALITAARLILTAVCLQTCGYIYNGTFVPIGMMMCLVLALGLWCCYKVFQKEKRSHHELFSQVAINTHY
jgi:DHA1 family bicyclomycin/chloramphenicol resistance-like MFS transporter